MAQNWGRVVPLAQTAGGGPSHCSLDPPSCQSGWLAELVWDSESPAAQPYSGVGPGAEPEGRGSAGAESGPLEELQQVLEPLPDRDVEVLPSLGGKEGMGEGTRHRLELCMVSRRKGRPLLLPAPPLAALPSRGPPQPPARLCAPTFLKGFMKPPPHPLGESDVRLAPSAALAPAPQEPFAWEHGHQGAFWARLDSRYSGRTVGGRMGSQAPPSFPEAPLGPGLDGPLPPPWVLSAGVGRGVVVCGQGLPSVPLGYSFRWCPLGGCPYSSLGAALGESMPLIPRCLPAG